MYDLCKLTRTYDGHPYCGPTSNHTPAEYKTLEEARKKVKVFNERNPIGWNIYNRETGKLVEGFNFFK